MCLFVSQVVIRHVDYSQNHCVDCNQHKIHHQQWGFQTIGINNRILCIGEMKYNIMPKEKNEWHNWNLHGYHINQEVKASTNFWHRA